MARLEVREVNHGLQAYARLLVQPLEAEMRKHPVLPHNGHEVRRDADDQKVQKRQQIFEVNAMSLGVGLHKLETDTATRQIVERIVAIRPLRIKHSRSRRNFVFRKMMVTNDYVNAFARGVFDFVNGFDSAVQCDYEAETVLSSPVDALPGHAVSFVVTVRDIEIGKRIQLMDKGIDQCHGSRAIDIIVSIDKNLFGT